MHPSPEAPDAFHIAEVGVPLDPDAPWGPVWDGMRDCMIAHGLDRYGYDDLAEDDNAGNLVHYSHQDERTKLWIVALRGPRPEGAPDGRVPGIRLVASEPAADLDPDDVLAVSFVAAPLLDNQHLLDVTYPELRPTDRGRGLEAAVLDAHEVIARRYDRPTLLGWVGHKGATAAEDADPPTILADPTGKVRLRRDDPTVSLLLDRGYAFAQAERHSVQPVPVPEDVLGPAADPSRAEAAGYEVLQWTGLSPDEYLDDLAVLATAMSTDPPLGEVDWRPEVWDAARVHRMEERNETVGSFATTVVRHRASGRLVGMTQVSASKPKPAVGYQWSTVVLKEHRGHGLGLLLKAANVRLLHDAFPAVRRVHTWNADENAYMLRVNVALGYRVENVDGCWQKVLA